MGLLRSGEALALFRYGHLEPEGAAQALAQRIRGGRFAVGHEHPPRVPAAWCPVTRIRLRGSGANALR